MSPNWRQKESGYCGSSWIRLSSLHIAHCSVISAHCTLQCHLCTLHTTQHTVITAHCTLHCHQCKMHCHLCTLQCHECILHTTLYCTVIFCKLYSTMSSLQTAHRSPPHCHHRTSHCHRCTVIAITLNIVNCTLPKANYICSCIWFDLILNALKTAPKATLVFCISVSRS